MLRNDDGRLIVTKENWKIITDVQKEATRSIQWRSDKDVWGVLEKWDFPRDSGRYMVEDCDGISLWKMRELISKGIPEEVLLLTICRTETNEGHAVLCITTDRGDFILDNREVNVVGYDFLKSKGYRFLYRSRIGGKLTGSWDRISS